MKCTNAVSALADGIYRTTTILCRSHSLARQKRKVICGKRPQKADFPIRKVRYSRNYLILLSLVFGRLLRCSRLLRLNRCGRLLGLCRSLIGHVGVPGLLLSRLLVLRLSLSRMRGLVSVVLLFHLVIGIAILRNAVVLVLTERQNHVEDGVQEEQTDGKTNSLPERDTLFIQGRDVDDDTDDDQQRAEQWDAAEYSADNRNEEQPTVAPEDFVPDVAAVKRNDGRPSGLTGFLEDFPAGHDVENGVCQDDEPKSSENAEKCAKGRRL